MAKKNQQLFVCNNCGAQTSAWSGKCFQCGEWNSLVEEVTIQSSHSKSAKALQPEPLKQAAARDVKRYATGITEIDMVFGGGLVPGSVTLIAGQPGIGKSTLLLQIGEALAHTKKVLYISGEESAHQIGLRATRLGTTHEDLHIVASTNADSIAQTIGAGDYPVAFVDSVQTISCDDVSSAAGSVSQITNSTHRIMQAAKHSNTAVVLVGHVTKEGAIAGPKILEHLVDVVLQLEGDRYGGFKILRAVKNRYGSTSETAIFEMQDGGLKPVENPSAALLEERQVTDGSIVLATLEGTRPLLVEVQALVNKTSYGYPKRTASGLDINRVNLLIAMLERRTSLSLSDYDIYLNVVGGLRVNDPGADLAVCMAIASAAKGFQLKKNVVVFGEVGLSGEVRRVPLVSARINEGIKLGFVGALGPASVRDKLPKSYIGVSHVRDALNQFLESDRKK